MKMYPLQKGRGAKKVSAMLKGWKEGGTKSVVVVLTWELKVLAISKGATKGFNPLKGGGGANIFTLS